MGVADQSIARLKVVADNRADIHARHETKLAEIATRDDKNASHEDKDMLRGYRERLDDLDTEIKDLTDHIEREQKADEESRRIRSIMTGGTAAGVDADGDGVVYRDFNAYARDMILARSTSSNGELAKLAENWGGEDEILKAKTRLQMMKRDTATTLTSDIAGLTPDQHINQIFQVIDSSRPIVNDAPRTTLERLTLTYPLVTGRPIVDVQASEKTEAGNVGLDVTMEDTTATTYLGGGNISWQAAQFSTPNAMDLWFRIVTADYALKTERDAAEVVTDSGALHLISSPLGATPSFADFMTAVGKGAAAVYAASGRMANRVYLAPDRWWYLFGLTSDAQAIFTNATGQGVGPLQFIASRGLETGEIVVGDREGLLVAEGAGNPVQMRVVEPAIGGFEVGLIGAFEAVVVDDGAFSLITTAS